MPAFLLATFECWFLKPSLQFFVNGSAKSGDCFLIDTAPSRRPPNITVEGDRKIS
jgi:hypothetical protein